MAGRSCDQRAAARVIVTRQQVGSACSFWTTAFRNETQRTPSRVPAGQVPRCNRRRARLAQCSRSAHGGVDEVACERVDGVAQGLRCARGRRLDTGGEPEVHCLDHDGVPGPTFRRPERRAQQGVLELANVAWPGVSAELGAGTDPEPELGDAEPLLRGVEEVPERRGMSSARSRSGGTSNGYTLSR